MSSTRSQSQLCTATPISSLFSVLTLHFGLWHRQCPDFRQAKSRTGNHVSSGMNWYICYSQLKHFSKQLYQVGLNGIWTYKYVFTTEAILEVAIESWLKWDLTPRPLIFVQTLQPTYLTGHEFNSLSEPSLYCFSNFISLFSVHISFRSLPSSVATFALSEVSQW